MANVNITVQRGGLGRLTEDTDKWVGLQIEVDTIPTSWNSDGGIVGLNRIEDLEVFNVSSTSTSNYHKLVYWHVSEVFRLAPEAKVFLRLSTYDGSPTPPAVSPDEPSEVFEAFRLHDNRIRLFGYVSVSRNLTDSNIYNDLTDALNTLVNDYGMPSRCMVTLKGDVAIDNSTFNNYRLMLDSSNDITDNGLASTIFTSLDVCGATGTYLGQMIRLSVHQRPSWKSFPIDGDGRWLTLGNVNGDNDENVSPTEVETRYTNGITYIGRINRSSRAYIINSRTAGAIGDDFDNINTGRTIDKAVGLVIDALNPLLEAPVYVNPSNGRISPESIALFQATAYNAINDAMVLGKTGNQVELSVDIATGSLPLTSVTVDPNQNVLSDDTVNIDISLVPVGAARNINVTIGFVASLQS